jgi:hypothetical protein
VSRGPRDRESFDGPVAVVVVVPAEVVRVGLDGADLQALSAISSAVDAAPDRQDDRPLDATGICDGPLEHAHTPHRSADHGEPRLEPEGVSERGLDATWSRTVITGNREP